MIKLSELFQDLAVGELNGTNLVEQGGISIEPTKLPRAIQSLNQAIARLYTLVPLKSSEVIVQLDKGLTRYYLDSAYAVSNTAKNNLPRYILDTPENPFLDDVLVVQNVWGEDGRELTINDHVSSNGVNTPEYNCILAKAGCFKYANIMVGYRASPERIPLDEPFDSKLILRIPSYLRSPLQALTASMIYMNNGGENYISQGNALYAKFRTLLEEANQQGMGYAAQLGSNIKPTLGGWL